MSEQEAGVDMTMGQLRLQLTTCQKDLGGAVEELSNVESQLKETGDPSLGLISALLSQLQAAVGQLNGVMGDIAGLEDDEEVAAHQDKLSKVSDFFKELDGLKSQMT
jgi:hypothetical protein